MRTKNEVGSAGMMSELCSRFMAVAVVVAGVGVRGVAAQLPPAEVIPSVLSATYDSGLPPAQFAPPQHLIRNAATKPSQLIPWAGGGAMLLEQVAFPGSPKKFVFHQIQAGVLTGLFQTELPLWGERAVPAWEGGFYMLGNLQASVMVDGFGITVNGPFVAGYNPAARLSWATDFPDAVGPAPMVAAGLPGAGVVVAYPTLTGSQVRCLGADGRMEWSLALSNLTTHAVASGISGRIVLGTSFGGTVSVGGRTMTSAGQQDGAVICLSRQGTVEWVLPVGGTLADGVTGVCVDASDRVHAGGTFTRQASTGGFSVQAFGGVGRDVFLCRIETNGTPGWLQNLGGPADETLQSLAGDDAGNACLAFASGTVFGGHSVVLVDANGGLAWHRQFPVANGAEVSGAMRMTVAMDRGGNVYVKGTMGAPTVIGPVPGWNYVDARNNPISVGYNTGDSTIGWMAAAPVVADPVPLDLYAGVWLRGPVGRTMRIEYGSDLAGSGGWAQRTNVLLTQSPMLWIDPDSRRQDGVFYRLELLP